MLAGWAIFPQGCFVADAGGEPVGYIFEQAWGKLGWLRLFGAQPQYQGQQTGQQLLDRAVEALRSAGCATIGLDTMPGS